MSKIFIGSLSAIQFLGEVEKEFTRFPSFPKPIVKKGDIVILEKIYAYNISKLLPTEWKMLDTNFIEVREDEELLEIIKEQEDIIKELEEVVAEHDLNDASDEDRLQNILDGLEANTLDVNTLSEYDKALYDNYLLNVPKISPNEAEKKLKPLAEFGTKEDLEIYALEEFGFELDKRLTLENMYKSLEDILFKKVDE